MSERENPNPLGLLSSTEPTPLSDEAEAARRQRIVGRIDALRASLQSAESTVAGDAAGETIAKRERARLASPWGRVAVVALPMAAALLFWLKSGDVAPEPLFVVTRGEVVVEASDGAHTLTRDQRWERGDDVNLETESERADIVLPSRTSLVLESRTRATINRVAPSRVAGGEAPLGHASKIGGEGVRVARGSVRVSATEPEERSVVVVTQQAEVVMRGTLFAVMVTASPASEQTRVIVHSGEASVLSGGREYRLTAGQEWASPLGPAGESGYGALATSGTEPRLNAAASTDAGVGSGAHKSTAKSAHTDLAQQNRMFESAQAARRAGQSTLALSRFTELISKFPGSEQAHNARVEHFRLLRTLGRRDEARRSAQVYLKTHPRGFAAAEARELTR